MIYRTLSGVAPMRATVLPQPSIVLQQRGIARAAVADAPKASPKAPPNAYQLFQKDPSVKSSFASQNLSLSEMSKKLAAEWKSMDEAAKKKYYDEQKMLKDAYDLAVGKPPKKATGRANAYSQYIKENFADAKSKEPSASPTEVMKKLAQAWNSLSASEKSKYKAS